MRAGGNKFPEFPHSSEERTEQLLKEVLDGILNWKEDRGALRRDNCMKEAIAMNKAYQKVKLKQIRY